LCNLEVGLPTMGRKPERSGMMPWSIRTAVG
jgi:hypothetical protein